MKKPFLETPLDALLALEHGIELVQARQKLSAYDLGYLHSMKLKMDGASISPETEHLLEPMVGDLIEVRSDYDNLYGIAEKKFFGWGLKGWTCGEHHFNKIIQRNGKPFPKIEWRDV